LPSKEDMPEDAFILDFNSRYLLKLIKTSFPVNIDFTNFILSY